VTQAGVAPCSYALNPPSATAQPQGGPGSFAIATTPNCSWTAASSNLDWLTVTSAPTGVGSASVSYNVAQNPGAQRVGTITVNGQAFTVTQPALPCTFSLAPTTQTIGPEGGGGSFTVTTNAGCQWNAIPGNPDWLAITSASAGNGPGQVTFSAPPNSGGQRVGTIVVNGQTFTVTQLAALPPAPLACTLTVSTTNPPAVSSSGGIVEITVTSPGGCNWTATPSDTWFGVVSGSPGTGTGMVVVGVLPNLNASDGNGHASRTGSLVIATQPAAASQTVTITQQAGS
jgi:hypothetical protein